MSFGATFGSVGDFIAICQLASKLGKALGDGYCGSSTEYRDLRNELDIFVQVLRHVEESRSRLTSHPSLLGLCRMIESIAGSCHSLVKDCLERIVPKYSHRLGSGTPRPRVADAVSKLQWAARERDQMRALQDKLRTATATLTVLVGLATQQLSRLDHQEVAEKMTHALEQQNKMERVMSSKLTTMGNLGQEHSQRLLTLDRRVESSAIRTSEAVGLTNKRLAQLVEDVQHVKYQMSNPLPQPALDPSKDFPVILEDALGYQLTVPMDWIDTWDGLYKLLQLRFEKLGKGQSLVKSRQFALEDHSSGLDVDQSVPISVSFRRGMKIDMSMLFPSEDSIAGACPRCRETANAPDNTTVQCGRCKGYFRFHVPDLQFPGTESTRASTGTNQPDHQAAFSVVDFKRIRILLQNHKGSPGDVVLLDASGRGLKTALSWMSTTFGGSHKAGRATPRVARTFPDCFSHDGHLADNAFTVIQ
ncbi:hypothetical protein QBC39DRAFT_356297 [Podospora conica]|nr:hypothetical protein QBC39DRAFT_356297 [Schizothecium conicum]